MSSKRIFFSILLAVLTLPLAGQETLLNREYNAKTGTSLSITAMSSNLPSTGYLALRVSARNGEKRDITWRLNLNSKDRAWGVGNELTSNFALTCAPGKQKNVELLIPLVTALSEFDSLSLSGNVTSSFPAESSRFEMQTEHDVFFPDILMSEALDTPNSGPLDAQTRSAAKHGRTSEFAGSFQPKSLSEDWRAYIGFDVIMLTSADWQQISPGGKTAISKWIRLGGRLILYATDSSVTLRSLGFPNSNKKLTLQKSSGQIELHDLPAGSLLIPAATVKLVQAGHLDPRNEVLVDNLVHHWPLQDAFGERSFNPIFLILILIIFGIIVGPVNLFVFAKSGQRHKLFITTPIISLVASAILLVIILIQDGFGGKGQRLALIEIQPEENSAYIHQQQIARTGVLLKTTFQTKNDTLVQPVALAPSRWSRITANNYGGESRYRLNLRGESELSWQGDWFKSRSEYGHLLTAVRSTRGRLELLSTSGPPVVTSTFAHLLTQVYFRDPSGSLWQSSEPIVSGQRSTLSPITKADYEDWLDQQEDKLHLNSAKRFALLTQRDDHFVALAGKEALLDTLSSLRWTESEALMTGPIVRP